MRVRQRHCAVGIIADTCRFPGYRIASSCCHKGIRTEHLVQTEFTHMYRLVVALLMILFSPIAGAIDCLGH